MNESSQLAEDTLLQEPRCLSRNDLGVDSKIVMKCVEHLIAHVSTIWIHSNETRSSTMNTPVLQQRFLALRSLIVASGLFTSFLKNGEHRSTRANINHELTSSTKTGHWVLPVQAVNLQNCTRNILVRRSDVSESKRSGFFTSTATVFNRHLCSVAIFKTHGCVPRCFSNLTRARLSR